MARTRRGRPPAGVEKKLIAAHMPKDDAQLFEQICRALDTDQAPIIRELVYGFIEEHRAAVEQHPNQGRLPIAVAS